MSAILLALASAGAAAPVTEESAVREFATICIAHFYDMAGMKRAASASSLHYVLNEPQTIYAWRVWVASGMTIEYYQGGRMSSRLSECRLTADLPRAVDRRRLYAAIEIIPGGVKADAERAKWFDGPAWLLPRVRSVVVKIDPARPQRVTLSLLPIGTIKVGT